MNGLYDILESYRQQNDPRFIYDGLYQDPLYNIATANPLKAMSPGYEYTNSDAINRYLKSGAYDMSGNVPADYNRAIDFKRYFENRPLKTLDYGNRFQDFKPRVGFPNTPVFGITPENFSTTSIMQQAPLDMDRFKGVSDMSVIDETTNDEQDQNYIGQVNKNKSTGLMDLIMSIALPGSGFLKNIEQDPRATGIRNFYSPEGLTSSGSIASGIMKGYNPVSGGFLNMITGGKYGKPTQYGLAGAMQRRIENILGRKAPQTDASRAKIAELRNLQLAEMTDRYDRGESLSDIGRSTFTGKGMAFEKQSGGVSGKGTANERNYGGR